MLQDEILFSVKSLPPFPETARRAMDILRDETASATDIVEVIKYDQNVTANILRLCNSAYFGFRSKVNSLQRAVALMGSRAVVELVMVSGSLSYYNEDVSGYGLEAKDMWGHSVSCAILSEILGKLISQADIPVLFTAGLLHDIGKVVLNSFVRDRFREILRLVKEENYSFIEAEREVLGIDHATVGGEVARKWKLPDSIRIPIERHHSFKHVKKGESTTVVVYLADKGCRLAGIGVGVDTLSLKKFGEALAVAKLSEEDMDRSLEELKKEWRKLAYMLRG